MGLFHRHSSDEKRPEGPPSHAPSAIAPPPAYPGVNQDNQSQSPTKEVAFLEPQGGFASSSTTANPVMFAALMLASTDKIRIIGFPGDIIQPIDTAIKTAWAPGIKLQKAYDQASWEWKLNGNPWYGQGSEAIPARRLVAHVLHALLENGWHLSLSTDLSKKSRDKDTLMFKRGEAKQRFIFSVSFNETDKVRIIDPPHDGVKQAFEAAVRGSWPLGVQEAREKEPGAWQLKLKGNPWYTSSGDQINYSRVLACAILSAMDSQGFDLLGSVDMSMGTENISELDTWFFVSKT